MAWKMARKVRRKIPDVSTGVEKKLDVSLLSDSAVMKRADTGTGTRVVLRVFLRGRCRRPRTEDALVQTWARTCDEVSRALRQWETRSTDADGSHGSDCKNAMLRCHNL